MSHIHYSLPIGAADYTHADPLRVTFTTLPSNGGDSSLCVTIILIDDTIKEGDEQFTVSISDGGGALVTSPSSAMVTIAGNDGRQDGVHTLTMYE